MGDTSIYNLNFTTDDYDPTWSETTQNQTQPTQETEPNATGWGVQGGIGSFMGLVSLAAGVDRYQSMVGTNNPQKKWARGLAGTGASFAATGFATDAAVSFRQMSEPTAPFDSTATTMKDLARVQLSSGGILLGTAAIVSDYEDKELSVRIINTGLGAGVIGLSVINMAGEFKSNDQASQTTNNEFISARQAREINSPIFSISGKL